MELIHKTCMAIVPRFGGTSGLAGILVTPKFRLLLLDLSFLAIVRLWFSDRQS